MAARLLPLIVALMGAGNCGAQALLIPPPAFSSVGGVTTIAVGNAANAGRLVGGYVVSSATLNLGGRMVSVPVALRVAANAGVFAATRLNPYVAAASLVAAAVPPLIEWFSRDPADVDLTVDASGHVVIPGGTSPLTLADIPVNDWSGALTLQQLAPGRTCINGGTIGVSGGYGLQCGGPLGMSNAAVATCSTMWSDGWSGFYCPAPGSLPQPATTNPTAPSPARLAELGIVPVYPSLLPYISPDIPVDPVPVINPSPISPVDPLISPSGNPAPYPQSQPFRVPNGEPIPVPNTDPQQYSQPWYEVTPSPTAQNPWQVNVTPVTTISTAPDGTSVIQAPPVIVPTDCDKYPNSLACVSLGSPPVEPSQVRVERDIALQSGGTFTGGACPPDMTFTVHGTSFTVPTMATACGWVSMARPVIILLAALTAIAIVRPGGGKNAKAA